MYPFFSRVDIQIFIPYLLYYRKLRFRITTHPYIKSTKVNARSLNSCILFPFFPTLLLQVQDGSERSVCREAFLLGNWILILHLNINAHFCMLSIMLIWAFLLFRTSSFLFSFPLLKYPSISFPPPTLESGPLTHRFYSKGEHNSNLLFT